MRLATGGGRIKAVLHRSGEGDVLPQDRAKGAASILRSGECDEDHSLIRAALLGGHDQRPPESGFAATVSLSLPSGRGSVCMPHRVGQRIRAVTVTMPKHRPERGVTVGLAQDLEVLFCCHADGERPASAREGLPQAGGWS